MVLESRRHFRIKDYLRVQWTVTAEKAASKVETGDATIMDISASGMRIMTDLPFQPFDKCVFLIEAPIGATLPFGPKKARLVWFKRVHIENKGRVLCGMEFLKDSKFDKELKDWLDEKVTKLAEATDARI